MLTNPLLDPKWQTKKKTDLHILGIFLYVRVTILEWYFRYKLIIYENKMSLLFSPLHHTISMLINLLNTQNYVFIKLIFFFLIKESDYGRDLWPSWRICQPFFAKSPRLSHTLLLNLSLCMSQSKLKRLSNFLLSWSRLHQILPSLVSQRAYLITLVVFPSSS